MRLDKYLKVSRLIKRRTVANEACDNERVTVNGRVARASYDVKVGDVITIRFGQKALSVEVLSVADTVGKALLDQGVIAGEDSSYGLYVKTVNGETADYDADGTYWGLYINGEYAMTGVDATTLEAGTTYAFRVEKVEG